RLTPVGSPVRMRGSRRMNEQRFWLRRVMLACVVAVAAAVSLHTSFTSTALAAASCPAGDSMYVVAHEDDSILFQNPDLQRDISNGRCIQTIFLTAGDSGNNIAYW